MDLRDLSYFETIATTATYEEAADRLGLTKQALTKAVRRLEQDLGGQLFLREGRGKAITPLGEVLLERARRLRLTVSDIEREVRGHAQGLAGVVRIGGGTTSVENLLPAAFRTLSEQAPGVRFELSIGMADALKDKLRRDELDIIVSPCHGEDETEFDTQVVLRDEVILATSPRHPLLQRGTVRIEDLAEARWALQSQSLSLRAWLDAAFITHGLPAPTPLIESDSMIMLHRMVEEMQLLTFCGRYMRRALVELPCPQVTMPRNFALMTRRDAYLPPAVHLLKSVILKTADPSGGPTP